MSAPGGRQVLLDTSMVIAPPLSGLALIADFVAVSAITYRGRAGVRVGAAADPVERQRRRRREQLVVDTFDVIPFDIAAVQSYGLLANLARTAGRDPGRGGSTC